MNCGVLRAERFKEFRDYNYGFEEKIIVDAPSDFVSTSKNPGETKGYLINLIDIKEGIHYGLGTVSGDQVKFNQDDVLVYDKEGNVFYAKGYSFDDRTFYNAKSFKNN